MSLTAADVVQYMVLAVVGALTLGLVSLLEMALVVSNRVKLRGRAREASDPQDLIEIARDPDQYLTVSIAASALVGVLTLTWPVAFGMARALPLAGTGGLVILAALLNAIVGEIVARQAMRPYAVSALVRLGPILHGLEKLFVPFRVVVGVVKGGLETHERSRAIQSDVGSQDELRLALEMAFQHGLLSPRDTLMAQGAIAFAARRVAQVMTPAVKMASTMPGRTVREVAQTIVATGFSRIPVVGEDGTARGLVHATDCLLALGTGREDLDGLLRPLRTTSPAVPLPQLLREFQSTGTQMALVRDGAGRIVGLVTLEDLLEEIVGEIEDEFDPKGQSRPGFKLEAPPPASSPAGGH